MTISKAWATALMPPLAVVGYGLATGAWSIAAGASLLFLTNVVAILAAVFGVARRYGFSPAARKGAAWEVPALFGVTILLCIPLALSLRTIVIEARETTRVRGAIEQTFKNAGPHITDLSVQTRQGAASDVQCVVVTRRYVAGAAQEIAKQLAPGARVSIEQVVTASGAPSPDMTQSVLGARATVSPPAAIGPEQRLRAMLGAAGQILAIEKGADALTVSYAMPAPATLADYQAVEQAAQRFVTELPVRIIPPITALPDVVFARGTTRLDPRAEQTVDTVAWALTRWSAGGAEVVGMASPNRRGRRAVDTQVALARASAVAVRLNDAGVKGVTVSSFVPERLEGDEAQYLRARIRMTPRSTPAPN